MAYNNCFVLKENLERVRERIAAAARRAGRDPAGIDLLCVTKGVPVERVREAAAAGVTEVGENRVQEAQAKRPALDDVLLRWHLVGHLQRNKAKFAVQLFDVIHSVDSLELIEALEQQMALRSAQGERRLEVFLQVNVSGEATKHGCKPGEAEALAKAMLKASHLKWAGLMTMAPPPAVGPQGLPPEAGPASPGAAGGGGGPYAEDPEKARSVFRQLRELRDALQDKFSQSAPHLSMGMSQDFEVAVEEGATIVRVGTAIFG